MIFLRRRNHKALFLLIQLALVGVCAAFGRANAQSVVLYLKSGDKISGQIISEYTNRLVLSNSWVKDLNVPLSQIERREMVAAASTNHVKGSNFLAKVKAKVPVTPPPPPLFKHWKGLAEVGLDLVYSTSDQKTYHGRFQLSYELPYVANPKNFFRNTLDYNVQYGKTTQKVSGKSVTTTSSDQMGASDKTSADFDRNWYSYNLAGVGFDRVRQITLDAEEGPGLGYHLLKLPAVTANVESGFNYQIQYHTDHTRQRDFFYRVAEDATVKISPNTTFGEKAELFPRFDFSEYRLRTEATLSYNLWRFVYLNMTVTDYYDTKPAAGAHPNELQVHSALGVKF